MCGVSGIIHFNRALSKNDLQHNSSIDIYHGLLSLQHRGQDAAGIMSYSMDERRFFWEKKLGLVNQAIGRDKLASLKGSMAIGHTRYATVGGQNLNDLQPMVSGFPYGIAMVHNGNLINYSQLREQIAPEMNIQLLTQNDLEFILQGLCYFMQQNAIQEQAGFEMDSLVYSFRSLVNIIKGGYSLLGMIANQGMFALRDPKGIRPLVWGKKKHEDGSESIMFASETTALNFLGHEVIGEVPPGRLIFVSRQGEVREFQISAEEETPCMFETVYFSGAESEVDNTTIYQKRLQLGQELGKEIKNLMPDYLQNIDVVMPVPDTSRTASIALAEQLKLPYREGLIKNRYIYRSFILPTQLERSQAVRHKLIPVESEIRGKRILLVDDSLVRGTTSQRIIELLRHYGAEKIYLALTCPPVKFPCYFGIDFPDQAELMASNRTSEEIAKAIGADNVFFLSVEGLAVGIGRKSFCKGCLDGVYPIETTCAESFANLRKNEKMLDMAIDEQTQMTREYNRGKRV